MSARAQASFEMLRLRGCDKKLAALRKSGWNANNIYVLANDLLSVKDSAITEFARSNFTAATPVASLCLMADRMSHLETLVIFSAALKTLENMKFTMRIAQSENGNCFAIEACLKNIKVIMLIEDHGAKRGIDIRTDWAGISEEMSCTQMQKAIETGLRQNGVDIKTTERHLHRDPHGGQMIRSAGKLHCENLAEGLIRSLDRQSKSDETSRRRKAVRTGREGA
jgi:hypothetical protein